MSRDDDRTGGDGERRDEEDSFDALGAAEELDQSLAGAGEEGRGESDPYIEMLEGEIAALQQELEQARARAQRAEERAAAAADEAERSMERIRREAGRERERDVRAALSRFLDVLDDLDRAIASAREMDHNPKVIEGVQLVQKRFLSVLAGFGVRHVPALGERFDPTVHEALSTVPVSDPSQDGAVVGVVSEGYAIGDEVLRPARVAVGKFQ